MFRSSTYFSSCVIQTERLLKNAVYISYETIYISQLDKRSQCHTSTHKFWWTTIVIKEEMITVTGSCIRRALCPLWCVNELYVRSRSLIFLLEQIVRLTNKSVVCIKLYLFYSSCIYWQKNVNNILLPTRNKVSQRKKLYKNCNPYFYSFCQDILRLG